jgi:hypothetical protein
MLWVFFRLVIFSIHEYYNGIMANMFITVILNDITEFEKVLMNPNLPLFSGTLLSLLFATVLFPSSYI